MDSDENFDLPESSDLIDTNFRLPAIQTTSLSSTIRSTEVKSLLRSSNSNMQIESLDEVRVTIKWTVFLFFDFDFFSWI